MKERASPRELARQAQDAHRAAHGRMTDVPAFQVPVTCEYLDDLDEGIATTHSPIVDPELITTVASNLPAEVRIEVVPADVGRGASGYGAAIEILAVASDVGGVIALAGLVRRAYTAISRHLGSPPRVSLGAARYLAVAHLIDHLGGIADDVEIVGASDLSDAPPDFSYTGFDNFWVALRHGDSLFSYIVDASGRACLVGSVPFVSTEPLGYRQVETKRT